MLPSGLSRVVWGLWALSLQGPGAQPAGQPTGWPSGWGNIKVQGRRPLRPGPADGQAVCLMKPACAFADTHGEGISPDWAKEHVLWLWGAGPSPCWPDMRGNLLAALLGLLVVLAAGKEDLGLQNFSLTQVAASGARHGERLSRPEGAWRPLGTRSL